MLTGCRADAATPLTGKAPPAGQLLPDDVGGIPAGRVESSVAAVGAEPGSGIAATR